MHCVPHIPPWPKVCCACIQSGDAERSQICASADRIRSQSKREIRVQFRILRSVVVSVATVVRESAGNLLCFRERQRGGRGEKNGRIDDIVARRVDLTALDVMYKPLELG